MTGSRPLAGVLAVLWCAVVATGFGMMLDFDFTPGDPGSPPTVWPVDSAIPRQPGRSNLLMILHPHCPCSRSSLDELEKIAARTGDLLGLQVLLVSPVGAGADWAGDESRLRALSIPGVAVFDDIDGVEAGRFNIITSGHTLLYDAAGTLRFSGGITPSRGHQGDNAGSRAILSFVDNPSMNQLTTPVFGCLVKVPPTCTP
ncbi:MAG TPA: RedB protein [Patescibacteria group bacterium]|jgi:hypothetical protein|nr:RedB protein [Patescibacteria group bacterium]